MLLVNYKELPWRERTLFQMQAAWEALSLLCQVNCFSKKPHKGGGFLCLYREKCQERVSQSADPKLPDCVISSTPLHRRVDSPVFLLPSPPAHCFPSGRKRSEDKFQFTLNPSSEPAPTLTRMHFNHYSGSAAGHHVGAIFKYSADQLF